MESNAIDPNTSVLMSEPKKTNGLAVFILIAAILLVVGLFAYAFTTKPASDTAGSMASTTASSTLDIVSNDTNEKLAQFIVRISTSTKTADIDFPDGYTTRVPIYWEDWNFLQPYIEVVDVNFDGYDDLLVSNSAGAYNMSANFYAQDPETRWFSEYQIGSESSDMEGDLSPGLGITSFNAEKREIGSFWKGRGVGDIYTLQTFSFRNGKWELAKTERQDWLGPRDNGYYLREIVEYNGKKSTTSTIYLKGEWKGGNASFDLIPVSKEEAMTHANDEIGG